MNQGCLGPNSGHVEVLTGGQLSVLTGGQLSVLTGGQLSVLTGGQLSVLTGGQLSVLTGGQLSVLTGAKRRRAEMPRTEGGSTTPSLTSAEDDVLQHKDGGLRMEVVPGGACIEPLTGSDSSFISGHPVLLLPVTKAEPESSSSDETDVSDAQFEADVNSSSFQEKTGSACAASTGLRSAEKQTEDLRALYCCYLKKEMENREQQMAFRALKMKKLEKEILLLDKQLM
ncbi:hypothetical protein D9C73_012033 [Collichthys lucidus]|uniref:Uncharacterized protein n=1 Tax=Collichthys lucidus TaxID=240159 RepID=A0A4U5UWD2_COLLU|nr:hypothetical protein D9C73_012033 [Collichthys lucidus]